MKQQEITITTHGEPSIETLTESEARAFYATLLARVLELYRQKRLKHESQSGGG